MYIVSIILAIAIEFVPLMYLLNKGSIKNDFVLLYFLLAVIIAMFLHEGIDKKRVKFGITWWKIIPTPYTHCDAEIDTSGYRKVLIMPFIVLGVIPLLIGIWISSALVIIFGTTLIVGAVGDLMVMYSIRTLSPKQKIVDHPKLIGVRLV